MNTPSTTRLPDWQVRFETFVRERQASPFAWGVNDCALFAADAVEAITGVHLLPDLRGHKDRRDAVPILRAVGGMSGLASQALGPMISPLMARIGDVVVVQMSDGTRRARALAICNGTDAIGPGPLGVVAVSMAQAVAAWRVG